ncbi:DNA polymerase [Gregarina niphandrodes]|uniref:DNA-directed DNA polymerase n=1 Tax=Gregarina niphandrodes TaxID=110365 RepID=A0A023BBW7_GRENI|nr:DNA polymerase [Gregarina niphandrodes]EZG81186.1 DNA polymerase [Gregarina niphandrodes]|eukprot:XP_011134244.1 DNA polymerase [Gregarina niphandrodes]
MSGLLIRLWDVVDYDLNRQERRYLLCKEHRSLFRRRYQNYKDVPLLAVAIIRDSAGQKLTGRGSDGSGIGGSGVDGCGVGGSGVVAGKVCFCRLDGIARSGEKALVTFLDACGLSGGRSKIFSRSARGTHVASSRDVYLLPQSDLENVEFAPHVLKLTPRKLISTSTILLSIDYCQIELRILTHFSRDPILSQILHEDKEDPFVLIASHWLRKKEISSEERRQAKQCVYAILYGQSGKSLKKQQMTNSMSLDNVRSPEALLPEGDNVGLMCSTVNDSTFHELRSALGIAALDDTLDSFKRVFPVTFDFITKLQAHVGKHLYITTLGNRRRYFPKLREDKRDGRSLRQAVNTLCQGSVADIMKYVCSSLNPVLQGRAHHVLQIHDQLLIEFEREYDERVTFDLVREIVEVCEDSLKLNIPLKVKWSIDRTWGKIA